MTLLFFIFLLQREILSTAITVKLLFVAFCVNSRSIAIYSVIIFSA